MGVRVPHVSFEELEARRWPTESRMTAVPNSVTTVLPDSGSPSPPICGTPNVRLCRSSTPPVVTDSGA